MIYNDLYQRNRKVFEVIVYNVCRCTEIAAVLDATYKIEEEYWYPVSSNPPKMSKEANY